MADRGVCLPKTRILGMQCTMCAHMYTAVRHDTHTNLSVQYVCICVLCGKLPLLGNIFTCTTGEKFAVIIILLCFTYMNK